MKNFALPLIAALLIIITITACDVESPDDPGGSTSHKVFDNAKHLTSDLADIKPRWSPSGHKVVFERRGFVYYIELLSGGTFYMTEGTSPCWSPDGNYIAFVKDGELYTIHDIPERPVVKLTTAANVSHVSGIDWGGNNRIIFFHQADSTNPHQRLYIYDMNTMTLSSVRHSDLGMCENPAWAPDESMILFSSQTMGICWIDSQRDILYRVVEYGIVGKCCWYWTIDSIYILFNENGSVFRIDPDGQNREVVYSNGFYPGSISYNSAKRQLAFNYEGIWIMDWPPEAGTSGQEDP